MPGPSRWTAKHKECQVAVDNVAAKYRAEIEQLRAQLQQWEEFDFERDNPRRLTQHILALMVERDQAQAAVAAVTEALAQTRASEHVFVIVGDKLARHLEWMIEEPNSGLLPEVLDAIKGASRRDVSQWLNALKQAGFTRPDEPSVSER